MLKRLVSNYKTYICTTSLGPWQDRPHYLRFTNSERMNPWLRALCHAFLTSESWSLGGSGFGHCTENQSFGGSLGCRLQFEFWARDRTQPQRSQLTGCTLLEPWKRHGLFLHDSLHYCPLSFHNDTIFRAIYSFYTVRTSCCNYNESVKQWLFIHYPSFLSCAQSLEMIPQ